MSDKLPYQITPGTPNDDSVVHASDADVSDLSRSHNERGISRLQGTAPAYSSSKTYALNDIVEESSIVYSNTIQESAILITKDERLQGYAHVKTFW